MADLLPAVKGESGRVPKADRSDPEKGPEPAHDGDRKQQEQQQQQQRQDDGQAPLDAFFKEVAHIKGLHESIRRYLSDLQDKHARSKSITRSDLLKQAREKIQEEVDEVNKVAAESKRRIEALDKENEEARKEPGCGPGSSQDRTRTSITTSLKKKLKDLTGEFQELRAKFHEDQKEQVTRWHYTATGQEISDEKAEEMIESGESEKLFQKEFLEQGRGQIIETVQEIRERREAVREMERKLYELHQIFLDMASLVESQGEMLDNVEESVNKSVDYVQRGTKSLKQAKDLQKSSRKWMCCGIIVFLIILAVVLGPALSSAGNLS